MKIAPYLDSIAPSPGLTQSAAYLGFVAARQVMNVQFALWLIEQPDDRDVTAEVIGTLSVLEQSRQLAETRADLMAMSQAHMLAVQRAVARGVPMDELHHGVGAFSDGAHRILDMLATPGTEAPMFLGAMPS